MEHNSTIIENGSSSTTESTPISTESPITMETGGISNEGKDLGWVAIMMLGLVSASLIYSIFYYRKRLDALKNGDNSAISQLQTDVNEIQEKIDILTGKKVKNATFI